MYLSSRSHKLNLQIAVSVIFLHSRLMPISRHTLSYLCTSIWFRVALLCVTCLPNWTVTLILFLTFLKTHRVEFHFTNALLTLYFSFLESLIGHSSNLSFVYTRTVYSFSFLPPPNYAFIHPVMFWLLSCSVLSLHYCVSNRSPSSTQSLLTQYFSIVSSSNLLRSPIRFPGRMSVFFSTVHTPGHPPTLPTCPRLHRYRRELLININPHFTISLGLPSSSYWPHIVIFHWPMCSRWLD